MYKGHHGDKEHPIKFLDLIRIIISDVFWWLIGLGIFIAPALYLFRAFGVMGIVLSTLLWIAAFILIVVIRAKIFKAMGQYKYAAALVRIRKIADITAVSIVALTVIGFIIRSMSHSG